MAEKDNIVLIGMPGAGKSTLGIVLAKILNYDFIDADLVIQNSCDKTLQKLIDACGPEGFIQVENEILRELNASKSIIATGGSAVYSDEAMKHLAEIGTIVYLKITYDQLVSRLSDLQERGVVLKGGIGMSLRELYDERLPLYEQYAEVTVDGGTAPAFEIMITNTAIRNLIREEKTHQLDSAIASGGAEGMRTMDQSLFDLVKSGRVAKEMALQYSIHQEALEKRFETEGL